MSAETINHPSPPAPADPGAGSRPAPRRRWPRLAALAAVAILVAAVSWGLGFGATYQPVVFGGMFVSPSGPHLISEQVNQIGGMQGQYYLPPQPHARGSFVISLGNTGPLSVTIESLSLLPPGLPASAINYGRPFRIEGHPTYTPEYNFRGVGSAGARPLAGMVLRPGQYIDVRIPFLTQPCWLPHSTWGIAGVWVTTRFLGWSRDVLISFTDPNDPSQGEIISQEGYVSPHAAPGLACPK